jgi:maleate cis-trans isomerase
MNLSEPYGYRARIGSISPAAISEIKPFEFYRAAPPGTTIAFAELTITEMENNQLDRAIDGIVDAAKALARTDVDFVVIAGTPLVVLKPEGFEAEIVAEVARVVDPIPVATSQMMEVAALRHLGMRRIAIATPWGDNVNVPLGEYMVRAGFDVAEVRGAGIPMARRGMIGNDAAADVGRALLEAQPDLDGLYIACPNWPTLFASVQLEAEFAKPVLAPIQAFVWYPLSQLGSFVPMPDRGALLAGTPLLSAVSAQG